MIHYAGSDVALELGDHVQYRAMLLFWRWRPGRISYIPGVSKVHPEMEHHGLQWVGVSGDDGTFRGILVEPGTSRIRQGVRFVRRSDGSAYLTPDQIRADEW